MGSTREEYPSDAPLSRNTWRIVVWIMAATLGAIALTIIAILAQPDVRRETPLWSDEFDAGANGWTFDPRDGSIARGELQLHPARPDAPALAIHALPVPGFVVETQARAIAGSTDNGYGLVVGNGREQTAFLISGDGYFNVMRNAGAGWVDVQPWRPWPHVRRGNAANTLRVECRAVSCIFYVNEEVTAQVETTRERNGIGLMTWRYAAEALTVEFEYVRVWE